MKGPRKAREPGEGGFQQGADIKLRTRAGHIYGSPTFMGAKISKMANHV